MSEQFDLRQSFTPTPHEDVPDWVNDYFRQINDYLSNLEDLLIETKHVEPRKQFDHDVIFADGVDFDPGRGRGLYYWDTLNDVLGGALGGSWVKLEGYTAALPGSTMNWRGVWEQNLYLKGDVVRDGEYLMIANKTTTDRPAPQPTGAATFAFADVPAWDGPTPSNTSVVTAGQAFTFTEDGWIQSLRVWPAAVGGNYVFTVTLITDGLATTIDNPLLLADQWNILGFSNQIITSGTVVLVTLNAVNAAANTVWEHPWVFSGTDNLTAPVVGNWNRNQQDTVLRINDVDDGSVDQSVDLAAIIVDTIITIRNAATPLDDFVQYRVTAPAVDSGAFFTYAVTVVDTNGTIAVGQLFDIEATIPIPDPTEYERLTNKWVAGEPTWATVTGELLYNGVEQTGEENNGFGTDILFQPASVSPDWDLMAISDL